MAWSVVAVARLKEEWSFVGFFSGQLVLENEIECPHPSAYLDEVFAILHAMVLASTAQTKVTIMYDCTAAAEVASHASKQTGHLCQQMSALAVILRQIGKWPDWGHVKGHSGDPFNELADIVAKAACKGTCVHSPHEEDRILVSIGEQWLAWIWPHVAALHDPLCWPCFDRDGQVFEPNHFPFQENISQAQAPRSCTQEGHDTQRDGARFNMNIASYNCLSLKLTGQVECIEAACAQRQLHVVGLQETKVQWSGSVHSSNYLRVGASANQRGLEGCQLWFLKGIDFGFWDSGDSFGWDFSSIAAVHPSERCLAVSARAGGLQFVCISAHAHTTCAKEGDVRHFWKFLSRVVMGLPPKAVRLFFLDANAHFDEHVPADGFYLPTNLNAQLLREFAQAHSLVLSDMWAPNGEAIFTWVSPQGHYKCLDFIAVPQCFNGYFQVQGSCDILDRFAGFDHFMLVAYMCFHQSGQIKTGKEARLDCRAMCTEEGQAKLCKILQNVPQIPWTMHASQHWDVVCKYLQDACRREFPMKSQGPRKAHIDFQTWELLGDQKHLRYLLRFKRIYVGKQISFACFRAWRLICSGDGVVQGPGAFLSIERVCRLHNFSVALLWQQLTVVRNRVGKALQRCQAQRVRACFEDSRSKRHGSTYGFYHQEGT